MRQISRKMWGFNIKTTIIWRVMFLRKCAKSLWHQILACWIGKSIRYRQLLNSSSRPLITTTMSCCRCTSVERTTSTIDVVTSVYHEFGSREMMGSSGEITTSCGGDNGDQDASDLVPLKICLLGDQHIGKTSFLEKYIGKENNEDELEGKRKDQMDKTVSIKGARISFSIWEVGGNAFYEDSDSSSSIPMACNDSVAMLFMFDLTSRRTLNSVINWHERARSYNQTAIPVMVGSKFDEFVQLPLDLQWTIANEARTYAKAINAPLFFSSASYNINVHKIFKFVTAKLFDLPWSLERNLTIGEPIIDF